ncbi:MAG: hypothetical protein IJA85_10290 [Clostridia bacterium]|nr:hypothetical protein [Clostridia bacterium]
MDGINNVVDFGAVGDGIHDDYAAFQAALDGDSNDVIIPQGVYCISHTLRVKSDTRIIADKTARIVMKSNHRRKRNEFLLSNSDTEKGNRNITIVGGIWDGNNTAPENAKPDIFDKTGYSGVLLNFVHLDGLVLKDMVLANSVTYYVRMCRVHHFDIEDISLFSDQFGANQDGLHIGGDVKHGVIRNIRALSYGQTNDDMIALNADDSIERVENLDLCRASIEDITIENIYTENCHTIIRMLSVTAEIKDIRFKNVYGGFRCYAINIDAARYCRTPLFSESEYTNGVGLISNVSFENFVCYPVLDLPQDFQGTRGVPETALKLESHMDRFRIVGFRYVTEAAKRCPAVKCAHIQKEKITADGREYHLRSTEECLTIEDFSELSIDYDAD